MINNNKKDLKIEYFVEYTNELERDQDFRNIKKLPRITDLETAISRMFLLRKQNKHNIAIGYEISDTNTNKLVIGDDAWELEYHTDTSKEDKLQTKISKQAETITELHNELELIKSFLIKYNALDRFNKEMKGW
ncbi:MAG: hypothetical protein WC123_07585 [Bacilli bacterium]